MALSETQVNQIFDAARVLLSLSFMFYASWSDWKSREVSNWVWVFLAPLAFGLTTIQYVFFARHLLFYYAFSFAITSILAVALFYAGAFGGADAKALMCLALAMPYYPIYLSFGLAFYSPIFPISVFGNAVLMATFTVFYALFRNLLWKLTNRERLFAGFENESFWRKIVAVITGYKVALKSFEKNTHTYPLEDIVTKETGENERRLVAFPKDESREAIVGRILSARREGKIQDGVWVTPGLPLLIFITAGLIIALVFGDIIWLVLRALLRPQI